MKKFIFLLTMLFAFTINANAQQDSEPTAQDKARKEAAMLAQTVNLNASQTEDFFRLFEMKYNTLDDKLLSTERKKEFLNIVMMKIQATLDGEQMKKLEADKVLFDRIQNGVKSK